MLRMHGDSSEIIVPLRGEAPSSFVVQSFQIYHRILAEITGAVWLLERWSDDMIERLVRVLLRSA
jgi:hypothetical protein